MLRSWRPTIAKNGLSSVRVLQASAIACGSHGTDTEIGEPSSGGAAEAARLDPHNGVGDGIEVFGAAERLRGDCVGLQAAAASDEAFVDEVGEQSGELG